MSAFLEGVRDKSAYPVFRIVTTISQFIGYLVAVVIAIAGFSSGKPLIVAGSLLLAAWVAVMARVFAEMSWMMADATDAMVQSAELLHQAVEIKGGSGDRVEPVLSTQTVAQDNHAN